MVTVILYILNKIIIELGDNIDYSVITHSGYDNPLHSEQNYNQNRNYFFSDNIDYSVITDSGYGNPLYSEQNFNQNRGGDNIGHSRITYSGYNNPLVYEQNSNQNRPSVKYMWNE